METTTREKSDSPRNGPNTAAVLEHLPLFACFSADELRQLHELFVEVSYGKGDTVCAEGEDGDTFFVILSGELEVWGGPDGRRIIGRLGPGECVGELSLLMGGKRAATVTAARSARLAALNKTAFDRFFRNNPKALEYLSRVLCKRLVTTSRGEVAAKKALTIGVTGGPGLKGKTLIASGLASFLRNIAAKDVLTVSIRSGTSSSRRAEVLSLTDASRAGGDHIRSHVRESDSETPALELAAEPAADRSTYLDALAAVIGGVGDRFPYIVFDCAARPKMAGEAVKEVSDIVVKIVDHSNPGPAADTGKHTRTYLAVNLYNKSSVSVPINHAEPFILREDARLRSLNGSALPHQLRANPSSTTAVTLRRLARKILGRSTGVAFGGGAAFGIAHIGVLKVLEDNDIAVDMVAGSSMGSIIAAACAAGIPASEMIDIAERIGTKWNTVSSVIRDLTLSRPALLAGYRLPALFGPLLGPVKSFDDLHLPCRAVAADIKTGERVSIGSGPIDVAWRASCAVPMVWSPVYHQGRVLVDGGVADPVPADVVNEMGADVCIGINVVPRPKKGVDSVLSRLYRRFNRLNPLSYLGGSQELPNMFDIVMNSMQMLQHELGNFKSISADVCINPDLSGFTWIEFYRPLELIERGVEAAERALPDIKRALAHRPSV